MPWFDTYEAAARRRAQRLRESPPVPPMPVEKIPDGRPMIYGRDYYIDDGGDTILTSSTWLPRQIESLVAMTLALIGVRR
ncbi:hypothetical protein GV794_02065 [Nocardia cyriacigeorgica]|uniref:Uncharacterized protein n=1 Tax=Nocardia cyriacigeorgica TaxID=135487 RepID=A0ABX0CKR6_9NOCA|nr:hypothetical protein [Nocardia cyriacigeorgica]NEW42746.1 hypothetical protein [Nocardia cyriacigeorgica]NEW53959.1 hypothetical protein [Nocardia cyriacigeorgica]NEW54452.1 hypothetical protein [Nocardia cyriacigeorgica]